MISIKDFELFHTNNPATFGFNVTFERNPQGYIINYHLIYFVPDRLLDTCKETIIER